jgi:hypothetical protein
MPRNVGIAMAVLAVALGIGLASLRAMHRNIKSGGDEQSADEQARHDVLAKPVASASDVAAKARIFWADVNAPGQVAPVDTDLALSADPVLRSQQLLHTLVTGPPTPDQRTLPADTTLLAFYVLPDGTAIADFSESLSTEMPSGILSEKTAVASIVETLKANVPVMARLKILIHGQEVDTLAGHADLTGFFDINLPAPAPSATAATPATTPVGASAGSGTPVGGNAPH